MDVSNKISNYIDAHNHLQDPRLGDAAPVIAAMRAAGVSRCVVNATREEDWAAVASLALAHPDFVIPAFGIHPWHAHLAADGWQARLVGLLETHLQAGIGECGLDQWISSPSIAIQMSVFLDQIRIARRMNRALSLHCLKAWEPLFGAFAEVTPPRRFLMHSFGGSIETARRLIPYGAYFSCSGYFLHVRKAKAIEAFKQLPADRILLETDAPDMVPPDAERTHPLSGSLNHPANLPCIGDALAERLGLDAGQFAQLTSRNAMRCFGNMPE
jgi:TatD DNase family protein